MGERRGSRRSERRGGPDNGRDNGLGGLAGPGPSRVGVGGAMRARDVSCPRPEDLEAAEREVVIRRRPTGQP